MLLLLPPPPPLLLPRQACPTSFRASVAKYGLPLAGSMCSVHGTMVEQRPRDDILARSRRATDAATAVSSAGPGACASPTHVRTVVVVAAAFTAAAAAASSTRPRRRRILARAHGPCSRLLSSELARASCWGERPSCRCDRRACRHQRRGCPHVLMPAPPPPSAAAVESRPTPPKLTPRGRSSMVMPRRVLMSSGLIIVKGFTFEGVQC